MRYTKEQQMRQRLAMEAARIIAESGNQDYQSAKKKAAAKKATQKTAKKKPAKKWKAEKSVFSYLQTKSFINAY